MEAVRVQNQLGEDAMRLPLLLALPWALAQLQERRGEIVTRELRASPLQHGTRGICRCFILARVANERV